MSVLASHTGEHTEDAVQIAAVAHSLGATVVTRNAKDFEAFDVAVLGYGDAT